MFLDRKAIVKCMAQFLYYKAKQRTKGFETPAF